MYHIFFIYSSVDGHFRCFQILAMVTNAAVNTGVHVSFQISVFIFFRNLHFHKQCTRVPGSKS